MIKCTRCTNKHLSQERTHRYADLTETQPEVDLGEFEIYRRTLVQTKKDLSLVCKQTSSQLAATEDEHLKTHKFFLNFFAYLYQTQLMLSRGTNAVDPLEKALWLQEVKEVHQSKQLTPPPTPPVAASAPAPVPAQPPGNPFTVAPAQSPFAKQAAVPKAQAPSAPSQTNNALPFGAKPAASFSSLASAHQTLFQSSGMKQPQASSFGGSRPGY